MSGAAKRLSHLLHGIVAISEGNDRAIQSVTADSRRVTPGSLFIALPGSQHDGRAFVADAVARGAAAVIYDARDFASPALSVPAVGVIDLAHHVSAIADRFYDTPSRRLIVIGVTGTNGKTTCTQILAQALDNMNRASEPTPPRAVSLGRCAIIGTLGYGFPGSLNPGLHTTPDAVTAQQLLADFVAAGASYAAMEVSSHALAQDRVKAIAFHTVVFTNLTRDHLDYHGDMENYAAAKSRLFLEYGVKAAVINRDDEYGRKLIAMLAGRMPVIAYGLSAGDVHARSLASTRDGLRLRAVTPQGEADIAAPLFGDFNASNLLAVLAALLALELDLHDAARRLSGMQPVPGRVERFKGADSRPLVVVDYAHTPDALEQVLRALRPHVAGRLWCVFGCGGNRDRGKRPEMGAIAERLADCVILTDDNPRRESGDMIIRDISSGMRMPARVIRDRRAATATAIAEAVAEDVVLIAGKGHEDYQQVGDARVPYSDRDTVRALLGLAA
jgi:UDP-N-acetylmuramoyl-L-alanyl-D-glutamate--2,6-diaminopimelate ligase